MQCQTAGSYLFAPVIYVTNARSFRHPAHMLQFPLFFFSVNSQEKYRECKVESGTEISHISDAN